MYVGIDTSNGSFRPRPRHGRETAATSGSTCRSSQDPAPPRLRHRHHSSERHPRRGHSQGSPRSLQSAPPLAPALPLTDRALRADVPPHPPALPPAHVVFNSLGCQSRMSCSGPRPSPAAAASTWGPLALAAPLAGSPMLSVQPLAAAATGCARPDDAAPPKDLPRRRTSPVQQPPAGHGSVAGSFATAGLRCVGW